MASLTSRFARLEQAGFPGDLTPAGRVAQARLNAGVPLQDMADAELGALLDNPTGRYLRGLPDDEFARVVAQGAVALSRVPIPGKGGRR